MRVGCDILELLELARRFPKTTFKHLYEKNKNNIMKVLTINEFKETMMNESYEWSNELLTLQVPSFLTNDPLGMEGVEGNALYTDFKNNTTFILFNNNQIGKYDSDIFNTSKLKKINKLRNPKWVQIPRGLTKDPLRMQGSMGLLLMTDIKTGTAYIYFGGENKIGLYDSDLFESKKSMMNERRRKYFIEVSVRDARKALDILDDQFRGEYTTDGTNYYIFNDEGVALDVEDEFDRQNIEIENTGVNESKKTNQRYKRDRNRYSMYESDTKLDIIKLAHKSNTYTRFKKRLKTANVNECLLLEMLDETNIENKDPRFNIYSYVKAMGLDPNEQIKVTSYFDFNKVYGK